jgi:hypothetical protein
MSISVGVESVGIDKRSLILPLLFCLSPFVTALVPRLTWLFLALIAITLCVRAFRQGVPWRTLFRFDAVSLAACLVALYVAINALWAANPGGAFGRAALLWGAILVVVAAGTAIAACDERQLRLAALGFAAGAALGAVYLLIETLTEGAILIAVMNAVPALRPDKLKHVAMKWGAVHKISLGELNPNVTIVMLSLWPALAALALAANRQRRVVLLGAVFAISAAGIALSQHQSSQIGLVLSLIAFPLAWYWPKPTIRGLAALWCLAFALVLPLDFAAYKAGLHMSPWLPDSARARVILWEYTAERTLEHPILGIGADSTHALKPATITRPEGFVFPRSSGEHAHNIFLQTWYELGLVGAILLALAGAALALRMLRLPRDIQPYAAATFAAFIGIAGFAWSMWQTWFMCAAALAILYLRVIAAAPREAAGPQAA